jgi:hypothetical protein
MLREGRVGRRAACGLNDAICELRERVRGDMQAVSLQLPPPTEKTTSSASFNIALMPSAVCQHGTELRAKRRDGCIKLNACTGGCDVLEVCMMLKPQCRGS